jgi:L-lactate dehydrogenase complex protein LldG
VVTDTATDASDVVHRFAAASRANSCTVHGPLDAAAVPEVVGNVVRDVLPPGTDATVAYARRDPSLRTIDLTDTLTGSAPSVVTPDDAEWTARLPYAHLGITGACLAVAEQGVFALAAGPAAPRAASLLPPAHLCIVFCDTIVARFAEAIEALATTDLPSALTWVGGPSRTGDLEMVQTLGVHGPKRVDVVLVR